MSLFKPLPSLYGRRQRKRGAELKVATLWCIGASVAAIAVARPASAQVIIAGQGVADRARPDYDPIGARVGSFTIYPSVTATAEATDNYLATNTDRRSDAYLVLQPEVVARSDFALTRVEARAFATQSVHASLPRENATQFGASASGAYEPTRDLQLRADVSAARYVESRTSLATFQGTREPIRFDALHAGIGVSNRFVDLTLSANAALDKRDFKDARLRVDNSPLDQDYRDVRIATVGGSAQYDLRNGIGLIVSAQYDDLHYPDDGGAPFLVGGAPLNRDSQGFNVLGGVTLELSRLIFGTVQVGYLTRDYEDPRLNDFSGLAINADVLWNVTALTSLRFRASRTVEDTSSPFVAGNTRTDFRASVDHELYRYLILSGEVGYGRFRPNGVQDDAFYVGGDEYYIGARARYLIDRRFTVSGGVRHSRRTSDSEFLRYNATFADVSLRVAF